ncbi:MAG TPA: AMP-binding protein, partial [Candidatus Xenobia bacterium]
MEQRVIDLALSVSADGRAGARRASLGASSTLEGDFGLGSLERAELRVRLEDAFGCRLPDQPFMAARSIGDLVALIQGAGRGDAVPLAAAVAPQVRALSHAGQARTLLEALALNAEATPEARAISFLKEGREEQTVTFRGLFEAVRRVAGGLQIQPGDRVGLMLPTGLGFVAAFFGTMAAGGVPVPMYPPVRPDQIQAFVERQSGILANAGARILVTFPAVTKVAPWLRARVPELREVAVVDDLLTASPVGTLPEPRTDDFAFIQYTSGSTGTPRGVVLSHANLLANIRAFGEVLPLQPDDVLVSWLPLYHDMGLIGMLLTPLFHGLPLVLMGPEDFLMRPSRWLRAFHEYGGSVTAAPNFAYELCARKVPDAEIVGLNLARWRVAINGAEP